MRLRLCQFTFQFGFLMLLMSVGLSAAANLAAGAQSGASDGRAYAGKWVGTYATDGGGSGNVTFTLSKDENGQWHGTIKYTNQDRERSAEL
jgi:hypothetical protein